MNTQQDVDEFLNYLVLALEKNICAIGNHFPAHLFKGRMKQRFDCLSCGYTSEIVNDTMVNIFCYGSIIQ